MFFPTPQTHTTAPLPQLALRVELRLQTITAAAVTAALYGQEAKELSLPLDTASALADLLQFQDNLDQRLLRRHLDLTRGYSPDQYPGQGYTELDYLHSPEAQRPDRLLPLCLYAQHRRELEAVLEIRVSARQRLTKFLEQLGQGWTPRQQKRLNRLQSHITHRLGYRPAPDAADPEISDHPERLTYYRSMEDLYQQAYGPGNARRLQRIAAGEDEYNDADDE